MLDMQDQLYAVFRQLTDKPQLLPQLALAFTRLQDCIRVSRGIPDPGALRPDLDPVQMARMLKRAKKRMPIDVPSDIRAALKKGGKKSWQESPEEKSAVESPSDNLPADDTTQD